MKIESIYYYLDRISLECIALLSLSFTIIKIKLSFLNIISYNEDGDFMQYIIIGIVLLIILLAILKANKKDVSLDFNRLVEALGGKENIIDTEIMLSRFKVTLKDVTKANKEAIQKLGAKGIVEIDNQLKIILGPDSKQLKKYIDDLK